MSNKITKNNIHIPDSYKVRNENTMKVVLLREEALHPDCEVFRHRTMDSLIREWRVHNRLYRWHILRSRTKDVDLNWPQPWWAKVGYFIFGGSL